MKKLTVISGKGGTGKTTFAANLAFLADNAVLADCDVDAPNLHLLMAPEIIESESYHGAKLAVKNNKLCSDCGNCREICSFNAIDAENEIKEYKCEGCGLCVAICPENAIKLQQRKTGEIYYSNSRSGPMVHARLKIGAENSGKLVSRVKNEAESWAERDEYELLIIDGSPGVGCPVIASLGGADGALIVAEPTETGISDLKRIVEVVEHFSIPAYMVINKYDINIELTHYIADYCKENNIPLWGKVPFDESVVEAMQEGELVVDYARDSSAAESLFEIWKLIDEIFRQDSSSVESLK
ncbi:ATP-binding protein [Halarsenatibacter silvermanii]|uniref:MinD superfamily P-loop ATPase, contains an inserted ferredoxin domain n=1 Tax=Halarsenatibacter silvermanii TaxID=321763 RepID=A0A1G9S2K4_9FIRM|nr:ATP-binding protein [Halarsenatibacter silvermanii]SDM29497.1 MinD superfamily P-loop ATPase, contains an inserted ferredoxin domain [Halarsenatibacter silvermanii]